jgi:hypothetical protein
MAILQSVRTTIVQFFQFCNLPQRNLSSEVRHSGLMAVALVHTLGHIAMRILVCLAGMNIEEFIQAIVTERQPGNRFWVTEHLPANP